MDEREELERLKQKYLSPRDDHADLERLREKFGLKKEPEMSFAERAPKEAWAGVTSIPAQISTGIDKFTMAPLRAGFAKSQELAQQPGKSFLDTAGDLPEVGKAIANQFGEDPSKAPTYGKLAENYGMSSEKNIPIPTVKNFGSPNARFQKGMASPADIAGAGVGFAADPANMIPFGKAGHFLQKSLAASAADAAAGGRAIGRTAVKTGSQFLGQVKPDDFEHYVAGHERMKGKTFEGFDPIKQDILNDADVVQNRVGQAEIKVRETKDALDKAKKTLKDKIDEGMTPTLDDVQAFQGLVEYDKSLQGFLSDKADEALSKQNIRVQTKHLKELVDDEIGSIKENTPSEASRKRILEDVRDRIDQNFAPVINGPMLRDWMQSIRKELANYQLSPGVYDTDLSNRAKSIAFRVSDMLKRQGETGLPGSPPSEYRQIMDMMAPYARASDEVSEMFSTPQKGAGTLSALHKGTPVIGQDVENKLRNYGSVTQIPEMNQLIDKKIQLRDFAKKIESEGPESFLKKEASDVDWAGLNLDEAKRRTKDISSLTEKNIDTPINNLSHSPTGKTSRAEYADQLKNLEDMVPRPEGSIPYATQIRDQGVLKRFDQERPATGFMTPVTAGIGGSIGTALGGLPGAAVGSTVGTLAGMGLVKKGGKIARGVIDASIPASGAIKYLEAKLQSPSPTFQKYLPYFQKAGDRGGQTLLLYHQLLWNNDPEYRKALTEGR